MSSITTLAGLSVSKLIGYLLNYFSPTEMQVKCATLATETSRTESKYWDIESQNWPKRSRWYTCDTLQLCNFKFSFLQNVTNHQLGWYIGPFVHSRSGIHCRPPSPSWRDDYMTDCLFTAPWTSPLYSLLTLLFGLCTCNCLTFQASVWLVETFGVIFFVFWIVFSYGNETQFQPAQLPNSWLQKKLHTKKRPKIQLGWPDKKV